MGFGYEISVLLLWVVWMLTQRRIAHKLEPGHWFHFLHKYFE